MRLPSLGAIAILRDQYRKTLWLTLQINILKTFRASITSTTNASTAICAARPHLIISSVTKTVAIRTSRSNPVRRRKKLAARKPKKAAQSRPLAITGHRRLFSHNARGWKLRAFCLVLRAARHNPWSNLFRVGYCCIVAWEIIGRAMANQCVQAFPAMDDTASSPRERAGYGSTGLTPFPRCQEVGTLVSAAPEALIRVRRTAKSWCRKAFAPTAGLLLRGCGGLLGGGRGWRRRGRCGGLETILGQHRSEVRMSPPVLGDLLHKVGH
jgi:hypothetical protein